MQCKVTYRITHDRGTDKFENVEPVTLGIGESHRATAEGALAFAPELSGPYRMVAETIVNCGVLGSEAAKTNNWTIQVSLATPT